MPAQGLTSADSGEPTGAGTPADALGEPKRMSTDTPESKDSDDVACPVCGDTFTSEHSMQIHRGHIHGPNTETCDVCGREFECPPSAAKRGGATLCSSECEREYRGFAEPVEYNCDWCGEPAVEQQNEYEQYDHHFCSAGCKYEWHSAEITGEDHPIYGTGDAEDVVCAQCDSTKRTDGANVRNNEKHFCDLECYGEWLSDNRNGKQNPQFEGGRFPYGPGWTEKKRRRVRIRDQARCQHCGRTEPEHIKKFDKKHAVHHITPARNVDDPSERNSMGNLVTLCVGKCHAVWERMAPLRPE